MKAAKQVRQLRAETDSVEEIPLVSADRQVNISGRCRDADVREVGTLTVEIVPDEVINDRELYWGYTSLVLPIDGSPAELLRTARGRLEEILRQRFGVKLSDPLSAAEVEGACAKIAEMESEELRIAASGGEQINYVQVSARVAKKLRDSDARSETSCEPSLSASFLDEQLFQLALELHGDVSDIEKFHLASADAERGFSAGVDFGMKFALLQAGLDHGDRIEGKRKSENALAARGRTDDDRRKVKLTFDAVRNSCRSDSEAYERVVNSLSELNLTVPKVRHIIKPSRGRAAK